MDLNSLNVNEWAENAHSFNLLSPVDESETDIEIKVLGADSKAARKGRMAALRHAAQCKSDGIEIDEDEVNALAYAPCISGWENLAIGNDVIEFGTENALMILRKYPFMAVQVASQVEKRANFTQKLPSK